MWPRRFYSRQTPPRLLLRGVVVVEPRGDVDVVERLDRLSRLTLPPFFLKTRVVVPLSSYTMQQGKIYDVIFKGVFKELTII